MALTVDGEYPFYECRNVKLEGTWLRNPDLNTDRYGDEMVSLPTKANTWQEKYLGDGSRYNEIYEANKAIIGSNPNVIKPGQTLTIPA